MLEWLLAALAGYLLGRRQAAGPVHPDLALRSGLHLLQRHRRVLALGARPGDLEREVGGTLWRLRQAGAEVAVAVLQPQPDGRGNPDEVALRELQQAQAVMGYARADLLPPCPGPDGLAALVGQLGQAWAAAGPDMVLAPARALLGQGALAVAEERGELEKVVLYGTDAPNTLVDISRALEQKWRALRAYPSALAGPDPLQRRLLPAAARRFGAGVPGTAVEGLYRL